MHFIKKQHNREGRKERCFFLFGIFLTVLLAWSSVTDAWAQEVSKARVNWMSFEEAVEKTKIEKRKIFIDVYTDWCSWCKVMDTKTFSESHVANLLNERFYPVKFNAEQLEDIVFKNKKYQFVPSGGRGYHQLAAQLLNNNLSYPTVVFMEEDLSQHYPFPGFRQPKEFYALLVFLSENRYKTGKVSWPSFLKNYTPPF